MASTETAPAGAAAGAGGQRYFATCAKGLEYLLVDELRALGAGQAREALAGVHFQGAADLGLRACLWSRLASRILLPLAEFDAADAQALYEGAGEVDWDRHIGPDRTFAIDAQARASKISQGMFAGQRVKDAIVDQLRGRHGRRPSVDAEQPDVRLNLRLVRDRAVLSLDLSGQPLHRRGWRTGQGEAPLKETLAAAMLLRADWPRIAAQGGGLLDPFCGIGTLVIEAAWMAADIAPGILRERPGCAGWAGFDAALWRRLREEADDRRQAGLSGLSMRLRGGDLDARLVELARSHAYAAGVGEFVRFEHTDALRRRPPEQPTALLIANLPYGARLGDDAGARELYRRFGQSLGEHHGDARVALLTLADGRGRALGLRARRRYALSNGALACELLLFDPPNREPASGPDVDKPLDEAAQMVANRLRKNLRHLGRQAQREGTTCWRLYDADLPEYAAAIDLYDGYAVVQEYQAPASVPAETARRRLGDLVRATRQVLAWPRERVIVKTRRRLKPGQGDQYQGQAGSQAPVVVQEGGLKFEVRLRDYLDTGLYLDHRLVRAWLREHAAGRDVLNLFCYTGAATVYAAAGGARSTTSVDLSATYLTWAKRNLELNGHAGAAHRLVQADVMRWLDQPGRYDLVYVDPPTFSNSKRADDFDVQRQHVDLLGRIAARLRPGGMILFSNHYRRFRLDRQALADRFGIEDLGPGMLPFDFRRDPRIHQVFLLRPHSGGIQ